MNLIDLREKKNNNDTNTRTRANDANKENWNVKRSDLQEEARPRQKQTDEAVPPSTSLEANLLPIIWEADEFEYHHKDGTWFLSAGIIGMATLAFAAMTRNFLMIPLIFIFAFVIYVFALKKPRLMEFEISGDGVAIKPAEGDGEGKFFPFKSLASFWIFERGGGWNELSFETDKLLYPHLKIPLAEDVNVKHLREILGGFIEEKEQEENLSEILARWLKF